MSENTSSTGPSAPPELGHLMAGLAPDTPARIDAMVARIRAASRIQVIGHLRPDGDCIGSLLAMHGILEWLGIEHAMAAADQIYPGYRQLAGYGLIDLAPRDGFNPDLAVYLDTSTKERAFPDWNPPGASICIDHHGSNTRFADESWVEPGCAATGEMLYLLMRRAGAPITPATANALLIAIMTDTGSFRYNSVRPEHFEICADLLRRGASAPLVAHAAYETVTRASVALGALIMAAIRYECGGAFGWSEARLELMEQHGGSVNLPENLVSDIRNIDGVRISLLLVEPKGAAGGMRASLRSDGLLNVSTLAQEFGGGGHPMAAGISINEGNFEALRDKIVNRVREAVAAALAK